jgi:hypothetical protein
MFVHVFYVPHTLAVQPIFQRCQAVFDKNCRAVFPRGPSAKHSGKINPGFGGQSGAYWNIALRTPCDK